MLPNRGLCIFRENLACKRYANYLAHRLVATGCVVEMLLSGKSARRMFSAVVAPLFFTDHYSQNLTSMLLTLCTLRALSELISKHEERRSKSPE